MTARFFFRLFALGCVSAGAGAGAPSEQEKLADLIEAELRGNILPWWLTHARDHERGGFHGQINANNEINPRAPRGALLTTRVLWTFSAAYRRYGDAAYLQMAQWAYDDLLARFWDRTHGGLHWSVDPDGTPRDSRKVVYVHAFAIYGLSEFSLATGDREPLDRAIELYRLLETHAHDTTNLGYFEEFTADWEISRERGRSSAMGSAGQKSQNTHLHLLEAYANLYRAWPEPEVRDRLREFSNVMLERILDPTTAHLGLFFNEDWTRASDEISFGHDIEFAWLMCEAAEVLGDDALLKRVRELAVRIADVTLREGVDDDGALLGEANPQGLTQTYKEWWPQVEGAVGFLNAYQISGDRRFLDPTQRVWRFITENLVDGTNGEWIHGVSRDRQERFSVKLSFWKCPYHSGRACLELIERLRGRRHVSTVPPKP